VELRLASKKRRHACGRQARPPQSIRDLASVHSSIAVETLRYHLTVGNSEINSVGDGLLERVGDVGRAQRIFLLSPANASGKRAKILLREGATFELALRLQQEGLTLGEAFAFISGLYFRGKLTYARAFATPPPGVPGTLVITACGGLVLPERTMAGEELCQISDAPVEAGEPRYRIPLERDARSLAARMSADCEVVLLGSIATPKYVQPLLGIFGDRLKFPSEFAGRGDMSRGGLMLRCVRDGVELNYVSVALGERHGARPAKLPKLAVHRPAAGGSALRSKQPQG
jgi:hypothetical protein